MNIKSIKLVIIAFLLANIIIPIASAETQLITNGGFESDLTGWNNYGPSAATVTDAESYSGSHSLQIGGYTAIIVDQTITPTPDYPMYSYLIFMLKAPSYPDMSPEPGATEQASLTITYSDTTLETWSINFYSNTWYRYVLSFDPNKTPVKIGFTTAEINEFYIDDVWLMGHNPTLKTCDGAGSEKLFFDYEEPVYIKGDDWRALKGPGVESYLTYVVPFGSLTDGASLPEPLMIYMSGHNIVLPDSNGEFGPTSIVPGWDFSGPTPETVYLPPGKYNVVVDVDHNMNYDEDYDMVSSFYIKSDFVIPEYPYGTFLSILTMIAALSIVKARKGPLGKF